MSEIPRLTPAIRIAHYLSIGFFIAGALLFYAAVRIALPAAAASRAISLLETTIHTADSIEVSFLSAASANPAATRYTTKLYPAEYAIAATKQLTTEQTKEFLAILQRHAFSASGGAACHDPGFLLRFTRNGHTILKGSLCLHCTNIEVEPFPFVPLWVAIFDKNTKDISLPEIEAFLSKLNKA